MRSLIERDVQDVAHIRHPSEVGRTLELLAHRTAELLNTSNLARDLGLNRETVDHGHVLESFVVQQLIAQAGWTNPDLRFWHYRDKDQVEVDLVITRGRQIWGVEVKASATATPTDGHGLRRLADQCGKDFAGGVLLYSGTSSFPLGDPRLMAAPLEKLWVI